jgi:hypothetical protein
MGMDLREKVWEGVDWIYPVQDRDLWRAAVITVVNLLTYLLHGAGYYLKR